MNEITGNIIKKEYSVTGNIENNSISIQGNISNINGDMNTKIYDKNKNGIVDNSELVNGFYVNRNVESDEYTNNEILDLITTKTEEIINDKVEIAVEQQINEKNLINKININYEPLTVENNSINIPLGNLNELEVVKSSNENNKIFIDNNGEMEINLINLNKLIQSEEDLILDGGNSII